MELKKIAHIECDFKSKFGIPRQSGIADEISGVIVFEPEYRNADALRGLDEFSHIWLLWGFSEVEMDGWSPTVRPPKLGGNKRMGVFATRSPYRPNPIGLSSVKIKKIELQSNKGPLIYILGADLMDATPVYDIKPYLSFTDSHPNASGGFADKINTPKLEVILPENPPNGLNKSDINNIIKILSDDPRPSYHPRDGRIYGMEYGKFEIKFSVTDKTLTVHSIEEKKYEGIKY